MKRAAARAALVYLVPDRIVGVGTGSTANHFIDALAERSDSIKGAVASSEASAERLRSHGIAVLDLNDVDRIPVYVDGADESNRQRHLIKGGGGALTREKIVAEASDLFICIADESKLVERLGAFPLPIEVIPMAQRLVANKITALGGRALLRDGFETDNGNLILDVHGLEIQDPVALEGTINQFPGVVTNGLFALRSADRLLLGQADGTVLEL